MSDGDKETEDAEHVEDTDVLAQQRHVSSRVCWCEYDARAHEKDEGEYKRECMYIHVYHRCMKHSCARIDPST